MIHDTVRTETGVSLPVLTAGRSMIAVEGDAAFEVARLADDIATRLRLADLTVLRASAADFATDLGVDIPFLRAALLLPFLAGESFPLRGSRADGSVLFDPRWTWAPADAILVVDGPGLRSPELRDLWRHVVSQEE